MILSDKLLFIDCTKLTEAQKIETQLKKINEVKEKSIGDKNLHPPKTILSKHVFWKRTFLHRTNYCQYIISLILRRHYNNLFGFISVFIFLFYSLLHTDIFDTDVDFIFTDYERVSLDLS